MTGMIGSLRGVLVERLLTGEVLVEVAGVGYRVQAGPPTASQLGDIGGQVFVWIHHHVREDAELLYGFAGRDERMCFEALIGAHGVGPALAQSILAVHEPENLRRVLADDDVGALCLVPGVGRKTAARLLVELKSRLDLPETETVVAGNGSAATAGTGAGAASIRVDVRTALANLGYGPDEIADGLRAVPDGSDRATGLRAALEHLGARR